MITKMRGKQGVTLIELMIVVAIVGILAAVAIPAYNDYVTRSRRSDAFTALETVRAAQEMYRAEQGVYANNFNLLAGCDTGMAGNNYTLALNWGDNTHYTVDATPQNTQAGDFPFRIDQDGVQYYNDGGWQQGEWEELR